MKRCRSMLQETGANKYVIKMSEFFIIYLFWCSIQQ
jgi:hypothetical protein